MKTHVTKQADLSTDDEVSQVKLARPELCSGLLEVVQGGPSNMTVRGLRPGTFRWVFSKNGTVIAISPTISVSIGQEYRAIGQGGATVGVNCG